VAVLSLPASLIDLAGEHGIDIELSLYDHD